MLTALIILPGFGLHAEDYANLAAFSGIASHTVFDCWPRDLQGVLQIGAPQTESHEAWMVQKSKECAAMIRRAAATHDRVVVFAHSAGGEFARRLNLPVITFGSRPMERKSVARLRGTSDKLMEAREDDVIIEGCGHFGCVTKSGFERATALQTSLGLPRLNEEHRDFSAEIGALVAREAQRPEAAVDVSQLPPDGEAQSQAPTRCQSPQSA